MSLITYPNASSFSVYSHIRHFVLQSKLCETFNSRISTWKEEGNSYAESEEEEKAEEGITLPVVSVVFAIIHIAAKMIGTTACCIDIYIYFNAACSGPYPCGPLSSGPYPVVHTYYTLCL